MVKYCCFVLCLLSCTQCADKSEKETLKVESEKVENIGLDLKQAENLAKLPLDCIMKEYPNKLNQVIGDSSYLKSPKELHPTFYGCFDWHSAVHGHWSLVKLIKTYPHLSSRNEAIVLLKQNISKENILKEITYFDDKYNSSYERTYGWAWLLKLAEELYTWDDPVGKELYQNLQPMTDMIVDKYLEFLPKLVYPIRVGEHTNTAFGLSFALDYALTAGNKELSQLINKRARDFYLMDKGCPINWEPSGFDFLSPCLEEAGLMSRLMVKEEFELWLENLLPALLDGSFQLETGKVSDRSDGKLVHLDGVNFSRAWNLYSISKKIGGSIHLNTIADAHVANSLPNLVGDDYEGGHWLGSFAIYALSASAE